MDSPWSVLRQAYWRKYNNCWMSRGPIYFGGAFIFGSLTTEQAIHSLDLFAREVRPSLTVAQRASVPEAHTAYTTTGNA